MYCYLAFCSQKLFDFLAFSGHPSCACVCGFFFFFFCYLMNHVGSAETLTTEKMILTGTDSRLADNNKNVDPNKQTFKFIGLLEVE